MRLFTVLILISISFVSTAQSLEDKISNSFCECMESTSSMQSRMKIMNFRGDCFDQVMVVHKDSILQMYDDLDSTNYSQFRKLEKHELGPNIVYSLALNCDVFYELLDSIRWNAVTAGDIENVKKDILDNNKTIEENPDARSYFKRGQNFFRLKEYDKAEEDFQKSIELDGSSKRPYIFIAMIKEAQGDLKGAKLVYESLIESQEEPMVKVFLGIIERKEKELH